MGAKVILCAWSVLKKGNQYNKKPQRKMMAVRLKILPKHFRLAQGIPFCHYKTHGIPNSEQKGRKYKIGWGESMPVCMFKGRIGEFTSGRIHDDHETDCHTAKNIQGQESLFWSYSHCRKFIYRLGQQVRKLYPMVKERMLISFLEFRF